MSGDSSENTLSIPLPKGNLRGAAVAWEPDDAEWYVGACDEEIFRWTNEPRDLTPDAARRAIEAYRREPTHAGFAIVDAASGALLGNIALVLTDPERRSGEVSYWLAAEARGRGAATDAVRVITRWAFDALPLDRIELLIRSGNSASQRVAEQARFVAAGEREGRLVFVLARHLPPDSPSLHIPR